MVILDEVEVSAGLFFVSVVMGVSTMLSSVVTSIESGASRRDGRIEFCGILVILGSIFGSPKESHMDSLFSTLS